MTAHHPNHHLLSLFPPILPPLIIPIPIPIPILPKRHHKTKHLPPQHPSFQPILHRPRIVLRHRPRRRVLHRLLVADERLAGLGVAHARGSEAEAGGEDCVGWGEGEGVGGCHFGGLAAVVAVWFGGLD